MRKFLALSLALSGALLLGAQTASALPATAVGSKAAVAVEGGGPAQHVHWRGHNRGFGIGFGFYNYPRYRYYNNYDYDQPRYSYYSQNYRHHRRHYCERHNRWEY